MKLNKGEKILMLSQDKAIIVDLTKRFSDVGFDVLVANDTNSALKLIEVAAPSVTLVDLDMQSPRGKDVLTYLKSKVTYFDTALIALSKEPDEDALVYAFLQGVSDYVNVSIPFKELLARINNQIRIHSMLKDLETKNKELRKRNVVLEQLAITDSLTELYNKGYISKRLESELIRSARYKEPITIILIDIDYFKKINDSLGHIAGDNILRKLSKLLIKLVRDVDIVARYGGEEFIIVCPNTSVSGAAILAERIRENVQNTIFHSGNIDIKITISLGVSSLSPSTPVNGEATTSKLIEEADLALYKAKSAGRNKVAVHTDELGAICIEDNSKYKQLFTSLSNTKDKFTH